MKKFLLVFALSLCSYIAGAQSRDTTVTRDQNTAVFRINGTEVAVISVNGIEQTESQQRSAAECAYKAKLACMKDKACWATCANNPACEISWYVSCLFGWL